MNFPYFSDVHFRYLFKNYLLWITVRNTIKMLENYNKEITIYTFMKYLLTRRLLGWLNFKNDIRPLPAIQHSILSALRIHNFATCSIANDNLDWNISCIFICNEEYYISYILWFFFCMPQKGQTMKILALNWADELKIRNTMTV